MRTLASHRLNGYTAILSLLLFCTIHPVATAQNWDSCSANINCDEGKDWDRVERSVVRIRIPGGGLCTGTLINNTRQDNTVYIITAGHCLDDALNNTDYAIEFNYEVPCGGTTSNRVTMEGGRVVMFDNTIDIGLIQMDDALPDGLDAYFAGWDRSLLADSKTHALIHHKAGFPKSIAIAPAGRTYEKSTFFNPTPRGRYFAEKFFTNGWSVGDMGGGSSGAGLFYDNEYYVGTLNGPKSGTPNLACNEITATNNETIRYTPVGHVWVNEIIEIADLKTFLDPINSDVQRLEGKEVNAAVLSNPSFDTPTNRIALYPTVLTGAQNTVHIETHTDQNSTYTVWDLKGTLVSSGIFAMQTTIDTQEFAAGMYIVSLLSENKKSTHRLVKL